MRIVQTLWTQQKPLLENGFGWIHPQYHLMSWALSCLSLRDNYKEVVLYTDSTGYKVLIEQLGLPYTDAIIQYDTLLCPKPHWAYPKLLTYSLQNDPFIHIDGDVYLPDKLSDSIEMSGLIAQNKETGSHYYKNMMNDILQKEFLMPSFLKEELEKESITSYNAGILGGNDVAFIKEYCQTAFDFVRTNHLNDVNNRHVHINNNILFEQILFHALAERQNKSVATVLTHDIRDNGYTYHEFCNFYSYHKTRLMHIIGGHKKDRRICELLGKTLLHEYPDYYKKVIELFPCHHRRLQCDIVHTAAPDMSIQMCVATYQDYLRALIREWEKISNEDLYHLEQYSSAYPVFLNATEEEQRSFVISRNPHLVIYDTPRHWPLEARSLLRGRINKDYDADSFDITCIPCLLEEGFREVLTNDLCYNILILLEKEQTFGCLLSELRSCFSTDIREDKDRIYRMIMAELEYLFYHRLIHVRLSE